MGLKCPSCGMDNPDDSYWCINCSHKLIRDVAEVEVKEIKSDDKIDDKVEEQLSDLAWDKNPKISSKVKLGVIVLFCVIIVFCSLYFLFPMVNNEDGASAEYGIDFWFEEDAIKTIDGWSFNITEVADYDIDGIVLGKKLYYKNDFPYRAYNYFSPIDLYIGLDSLLLKPDEYPYRITTFSYRECIIEYIGEDVTKELYFDYHSDNYHIIPKTQNVFDNLSLINVNDQVKIEGTLVSVKGIKDDESYEWLSYDENNRNKILLIDVLTIT